MKSDTAIWVQNLRKEFGSFVAVDDISLEVPTGWVFGLLGPNGAGKTTTIRMLLGLLRPSAGQVRVLGLDPYTQRGRLRQLVGYMSQRFSLYDGLTVLENLRFYGQVYGLTSAALRKRVPEVLWLVGLEGRERELARNLAFGLKQRLALAAAIIHRPQVLFLDEPTAGVDPISRRAFWDLLYDLSTQGATIVVTTHYMDEAERCQSLALIDQGRVVASGSPHELRHAPEIGEVIEVYCEQPEEALVALQGLPGLQDVALHGGVVRVLSRAVEVDLPRVQEALSAAGLRTAEVAVVEPTLEEVFVACTRARPAAIRVMEAAE